MSVLPNAVYANPNTPCWEADTTGGGLNPTFDNVTINQGGAITMGSSITEGTQMFWNKNLAGTTYTQTVMGYDEPAAGTLSLTFLDETNDYDRIKVGNVYAFGDGTGYGGAAPQIVMGNASGALGLALKNGTTGTVTPVLSQSSPSVTTFDLSNIKTLNGSAVFAPANGSFSSTQIQAVSSASATPIVYDTEDITPAGVTCVTPSADIRVTAAGLYKVLASAQCDKTGGGAAPLEMWVAINGNAVPNSGTRLAINQNQEAVMTVEWLLSLAATDLVSVNCFDPTATNDLRLLAIPAAGPVPAIPSIITTIVRIA